MGNENDTGRILFSGDKGSVERSKPNRLGTL